MVVAFVGVFVIFSVAEIFHQAGGSVAEMKGNRLISSLAYRLKSRVDGHVSRIAFKGCGQIYGAFGKDYSAFGPTDLVDGVESGVGQKKSIRIGQTNIFGSKNA